MVNSVSLRVMSAALVLCTAAASAASLQQGRTTDDSVCDLGSNTTSVIGRKVLIPASGQSAEEAEAYLRMATLFIASRCADGQTLILGSRAGIPLDATYLPEVAGRACALSAIQRTPTSSTNDISGATEHGFELRCPVSKLQSLKQAVEERESKLSTDLFLRNLQQKARAAAQ